MPDRTITLRPGESFVLSDGTTIVAAESLDRKVSTGLSMHTGRMNALDIAIKTAEGVGKLAAAIGVGQSVVSNWRARGTTPDAVHCVAIERATSGVVTRQALRPEDWHLIWPELAVDASAVQEAAHG